MINSRVHATGNIAVSLWEICWNENWTERNSVLLKVNIHMQIVGVECKFHSDICVDKNSASSPDSKKEGGGDYFMTRLSGNSASKRSFKDHRLH